ncbi:MAG: sigma-54 dependent transcriptional regulator [Pseudomonadota bacterium]
MIAPPSHGLLALYVCEGAASFHDRVLAAMSGSGAKVQRVDTVPGMAQMDAHIPAIAVVSVSVLEHDRSWYGEHDLRIIWVARHPPLSYTLDPLGGRTLLPPDFTDVELREMVASFVPRPRIMPRMPGGMVIVAKSRPMIELLDEVAAFADSDHNVLIEGETGVGKELVAEILHQGHHRFSKGAFVAVNCGAIPDGLFESLFFGHTRGAFTGALQAHKGYLEQANGGTLFLDEIGELPAFQQVKLLRVLQSGHVTRVGSEKTEHFDFRLVAATNRSLREQVRNASFRPDLFYRLAVIELHVPNLEQRGSVDKIAIFETLLMRTLEVTDPHRHVPQWLTDQVGTMRFPGNVRQLQNLAERVGVIVRQTGDWDMRLIMRAMEQVQQSESTGAADGTRPHINAEERDRILAELERNGWQRQKIAEHLGISRKSLWEKMRRYGIRGDDDHSGRLMDRPA